MIAADLINFGLLVVPRKKGLSHFYFLKASDNLSDRTKILMARSLKSVVDLVSLR
jgi:hypothetical protein